MNTKSTKNQKSSKNQKLSTVPVTLPASRAEVALLCQETTRLTLERDAKQVALDKIVNRLKEKRCVPIESLDTAIAQNVERLKAWSVAFRQQEFGERQSIKVAGSKLEFRKGSGKVVSELDEDVLLRQIESLPDGFSEEKDQLVRKCCELNKTGVVAILRKEGGAALLNRLGLRVIVEEEFKFTPAREDLTPLPLVSGEPTVVRETECQVMRPAGSLQLLAN